MFPLFRFSFIIGFRMHFVSVWVFLLVELRVSVFARWSIPFPSRLVVVTRSNFVYWDAAVRTNAFLINTKTSGTRATGHGAVVTRNRARNGGHLLLHQDIVEIRRADHRTCMQTRRSWAFWQFMKNLNVLSKLNSARFTEMNVFHLPRLWFYS